MSTRKGGRKAALFHVSLMTQNPQDPWSRLLTPEPKSSNLANLLADAPISREMKPYESILKSLIETQSTPKTTSPYESLFKTPLTKRKVFVSYHHTGDHYYYHEFSRLFADAYDVCDDNSVDREIDSDNAEYVIRTIRENYLTGASCTIVLCGAQTPWRKFVDWEIKATLDKRHALIGVNLPTNPRDAMGRVYVPSRLHDNIESGFAIWREWSDLEAGGPNTLRSWIEAARSSTADRIRNQRLLRSRNG